MRGHARAVADALRSGGFAGALLLEPGRAVVADAVRLAFTVVAVKSLRDGRRCLICDAGTNLLPGALADPPAIEAPENSGPRSPALVTGPLCLNTDVLQAAAPLPVVSPGDALVALEVGAYQQAASTQFGEPRPAVVIRERGVWGRTYARGRTTGTGCHAFEERSPMSQRLIVIGGGGAGTAAATIAKRCNPDLHVTVFSEFPDIAYSPCGMPFVHGKEIPKFENLFMSTVERYRDDGLDMRMETTITDIDLDRGTVTARNTHEGFDKLILATGFPWEKPDVPGANLDGLHYVKDIRAAAEFDKQLDSYKRAVVIGGCGSGSRWPARSAVADCTSTSSTRVRGLSRAGRPGRRRTGPRGARRRAGSRPDGDQAPGVRRRWRARPRRVDVGRRARLRRRRDLRSRSCPTRAGAGDRDEARDLRSGGRRRPHADIGAGRLGRRRRDRGPARPVDAADQRADRRPRLLPGPRGRRERGRENRHYDPVWIPWGFMSGDYTIGGFSIGETLAEAMGIPYLVAKGVGVSRARYFPGAARTHVKLLAEPGTLRLIGAQLHGGEGIKERCDFLAFVAKRGATLDDLACMENIYSPPIGALYEPIQIAAQNGLAAVQAQARDKVPA